MEKNSKILVAGGSGLVGSAIVKTLINKGFTNILSASRNERYLENVKNCKIDFLKEQEVSNLFNDEKPEYVFLAAAKVGGIIANSIYRGQFIYENLTIQNNIIHHSYLNKVQKLLFLGSSCIYPRACPQPISEEYLLTNELEYTNEPYAIAKIAGIKMCESYNLQYGTNFISVMPTNLYGDNDNFDLEKSHVLPALIRKMHLGKCLVDENEIALRKDLNKNPIEGISGENSTHEINEILAKYGITKNNGKVTITLWGSGNPRREFLHSNDLAEAVVFLMENVSFENILTSEYNIKFNNTEIFKYPIKNTHFNIGTGMDLTIRELSEMIREIVGYTGDIIWDSNKPDGTFQKLLNVSKINNYGWKAQTELYFGINEVYRKYCS